MQASFQATDTDGRFLFGSLERIQGDALQINMDACPCAPGEAFDFRLELTERGVWAYGRAVLSSALLPTPSGSTMFRCDIVSWRSDEDEQHLRNWLEECAQGGTSRHPERWVSSLSHSHSSTSARGREAISEALRDHVRGRRSRRPQALPSEQ